jgi:hypothetical protein
VVGAAVLADEAVRHLSCSAVYVGPPPGGGSGAPTGWPAALGLFGVEVLGVLAVGMAGWIRFDRVRRAGRSDAHPAPPS